MNYWNAIIIMILGFAMGYGARYGQEQARKWLDPKSEEDAKAMPRPAPSAEDKL